MTNLNTRLAVDLDDLERQLRQGKPPSDSNRNDPLAELARIVGQEDPFSAVLGGDEAARPPAQAQAQAQAPAAPRREANAPAAGRAAQPGASLDAPSRAEPAMASGPAQGSFYDEPGPAFSPRYDDAAYQEHADPAQGGVEQRPMVRELALEPHDPRRSRKGLMAVGAVLGIAVLGVAGALALRSGGGSRTAAGGPPIIQADRNPLKVQPQNPGGADIPDQNKQIYERRAPNGQTRVVNRDEQPLDVQQAARERSGSESTASVPSTATPGSGAGPASLAASLGEPRRVRTVSIKPEAGGSNQEAQRQEAQRQEAQRQAASAPPAVPNTPLSIPAPSASVTTPSAAPATPPPPARPRPEAAKSTAPAPTPAPAAKPPVAPSDEGQAAAEEPRPGRTPQRAAALTPPAAPAEKASTAAGGFSVQLAVRPSEKEARAAFKELQQKFSGDLDGRSPLILQAEVNGKSVYRIRVGPMAREAATSLCTKLKSSGGQCFVAKD